MGSTGIARGFCYFSSINSPASPSSSRHRHLLSSTLELNSHPSSFKRALHSLLPKPNCYRAQSRCPSRIQSIKATGLSSLPLKKNPEEEEEEEAMTVTTSVRISDKKLIIKGRAILTGVPDTVTLSSAASLVLLMEFSSVPSSINLILIMLFLSVL